MKVGVIGLGGQLNDEFHSQGPFPFFVAMGDSEFLIDCAANGAEWSVADHRQCCETELPAALDDLGNAVHRDQLFLKLVSVCHRLSA